MTDAVRRCECGQTHAWCKANECPELPLPAAATIESLQAKVAELEKELAEERRLAPTLTKTESGELVAVTMTDDEHRIHKVLWERDR